MLHFFKKKSVQYGIPFILFMIGGTFGLKEFQELRFKYKKPLVDQDVREEALKKGIKMKQKGEITLETEYDKIKDHDFNSWENKRIPRPWNEEEEANKV